MLLFAIPITAIGLMFLWISTNATTNYFGRAITFLMGVSFTYAGGRVCRNALRPTKSAFICG